MDNKFIRDNHNLLFSFSQIIAAPLNAYCVPVIPLWTLGLQGLRGYRLCFIHLTSVFTHSCDRQEEVQLLWGGQGKQWAQAGVPPAAQDLTPHAFPEHSWGSWWTGVASTFLLPSDSPPLRCSTWKEDPPATFLSCKGLFQGIAWLWGGSWRTLFESPPTLCCRPQNPVITLAHCMANTQVYLMTCPLSLLLWGHLLSVADNASRK